MYRVQLRDFEGPLDLLLYFIRRDELDIFDIPIYDIADEYLEYVRVLEDIDLDSVGDFLYMAAVLINIKAKMLLPTKELDEEGEPIDPRRELVERLLEYLRYKEASQNLAYLETERSEHFTRGDASSERERWQAEQEVTVDATVFDLISALRRVLTMVPEAATHDIFREEYSIEGQQSFILAVVADQGRVSFVEAVRGRSKAFIVTTFLGILELARQQRVSIIIEDDHQDFFIEELVVEIEEIDAAELEKTTDSH